MRGARSRRRPAPIRYAGDIVVLGVHAGAEPTWVRLPLDDSAYDLVLDTRSWATCDTIPYRIGAGRRLDLAPRTLVLLTAVPESPTHPRTRGDHAIRHGIRW